MNHFTQKHHFIRAIGLIMITLLVTTALFWSQPHEANAAETIYNSDLYYTYPNYLKTSNPKVTQAVNDASEAMRNLNTRDEIILIGQSVLKDSESATIGWLLEQLETEEIEIDTSFYDKCQQEAAEKLLETMSQSESIIHQMYSDSEDIDDIVKSMKNGYEWAEYTYDRVMKGVNTEVIEEVVKSGESQSKLEDVSESLGTTYDTAKDTLEVISIIKMLEGIQMQQIDYLIDHVNEDLAGPIIKYKSYIENNYQEYIYDKFIKEKTIEKIFSLKALIKAVEGENTLSVAYEVFSAFCELLATAESELTDLGSASDYIAAEILYCYETQLYSALINQHSTIITSPVYPSTIQEYELGYEVYLASVRALADQASSVNGDYEDTLKEDIEAIKNFSIDEHYKDCKKAILDIDPADRRERSVDPDKQYEIDHTTGGYDIVGPSDSFEDNTLYTGNGKTYYSINLSKVPLNILTDVSIPNLIASEGLSGNNNSIITVKSGKTLTADTIYICGNIIEVEDQAVIHVISKFTGAGNNYTTDGRTSLVNNRGTILVDGELFGDGTYGIYTYTASEYVIMEMFEGSVLTVNGPATDWGIRSGGTMTFRDSVAIDAKSTPKNKVQMIFDTPAGKNISLGDLSFTAKEGDSQGGQIRISYDTEENYYKITGSAPNYDVSSSSTEKSYRLPTGGTYSDFSIQGKWYISDSFTANDVTTEKYGYLYAEENSNLQINGTLNCYSSSAIQLDDDSFLVKEGSTVNVQSINTDGTHTTIAQGGTLNVSGDFKLHGNDYPTDGRHAYLDVYGNLYVNGKLYGDGEYGTMGNYGGARVTHTNIHQGAYLQVDGDFIDTTGTINGQVKVTGSLSFNGDISDTGHVNVDAPAGKDISIAGLSFSPVEGDNEGCKLELRYDETLGGNQFRVNAPNYNLSTSSSNKIKMTGPSYLNDVTFNYADWYLDGDLTLGAVVWNKTSPLTFTENARVKMKSLTLSKARFAIDKGAEVEVENDVKLTGNDYYTDGLHSYLEVYGTLKVNHDLYGDGSYGIYTYSGSSVTHTTVYEGGTLRIEGEIRDTDLKVYGSLIQPCKEHENIEIVGAKDATSEEEGYTGDSVCSDCGTVISKGTSIPKLPSTEEEPESDDTSDTSESDDTPTVPVVVLKNNKITVPSSFTKVYSTKAQAFNLGAKCLGNAKITYASNNPSILVNASGKVTIKAKYIGKATITLRSAATASYKAAATKVVVTVNPTPTKISSVSNVKGKKLLVKWKRNPIVSGYQIQYSTNSAFKKGNKTVTVKKNTSVKRTISKLTKGKTYYVRIRTYKTVSKANYYSTWSTKKKVVIKK